MSASLSTYPLFISNKVSGTIVLLLSLLVFDSVSVTTRVHLFLTFCSVKTSVHLTVCLSCTWNHTGAFVLLVGLAVCWCRSSFIPYSSQQSDKYQIYISDGSWLQKLRLWLYNVDSVFHLSGTVVLASYQSDYLISLSLSPLSCLSSSMASFCTRHLLQKVSLFFFFPDVFCLLTSISSVVTRVGLCCAGLLIKQRVHTLCPSRMHTHTCTHSFHPCWFTLRCRCFSKNSWMLTCSYRSLPSVWYLCLCLCCCLVRTFLSSQMGLMFFHSRGPGGKIILMWLLHKCNHCVCFYVGRCFPGEDSFPRVCPILDHSLSSFSLLLFPFSSMPPLPASVLSSKVKPRNYQSMFCCLAPLASCSYTTQAQTTLVVFLLGHKTTTKSQK